jgi:hypothetical protein
MLRAGGTWRGLGVFTAATLMPALALVAGRGTASGRRLALPRSAQSVHEPRAEIHPPVPRPPDARLNHQVKEEQVGGTLGEYVALLGEKTKVEQKVVRPLAERGLLALSIDTTLARLHEALARNSQLTWRATADRVPKYTLAESSDDQHRRRSALLVMQAQARAQLLARWQEIRRLAFLSPDELKRLADSGDSKAASLAQSPAMAQMLFQLPDAAMQQFWGQGATRVPIAALPPEAQAQARSLARKDLPDPDFVTREGHIQMKVGGTPDRPTIYAEMHYGKDGIEHNLLYNEGTTRQPPQERREQAKRKPSKPPRDPRFKKKVTLRDPAVNGAEQPGERPPKAKPLAELLQDLAGQVNLPIVAECEYKPREVRWLRRQWWLAEEIVDTPLTEALDLLCADFEYEWRFMDGFLLLRPRLWFLEPAQRQYIYPKFH